MHACTIVARNYLAHARTLAESYLARHPDGRFTVLVLDAPYEHLLRDEDGFEVLEPTAIGLPAHELERLLTLYDVKELATAVKPWLLQTLLAGGAGAAMYLDPDIVVFDALDGIDELAREHGIVLTPHVLEPMVEDGRTPCELGLLVAGIYNLGFLAVGEGGRDFLAWWSERLARDCVEGAEPGLFVDQKWVDFAPAYWHCHILRDRGANVAYWNLPTRRIEAVEGGYEVDGEPLRFFHYSGYSPSRPDKLSKFQSEPARVDLDERPLLRALCDDYAARLDRNGFAGCSRVPYAFDAPGGIPLDRPLRRLYRTVLKQSEASQRPEPPNPFGHGVRAWIEWLREPVDPSSSGLSRYLHLLLMQSAVLRASFPGAPGPDTPVFLEWLAQEGEARLGVPSQLLPEPHRPVIEGLRTRRLAVLAFADELAAEPDLLAGWGATFDAGADATLVILAHGDADRATQGVLAALEGAGLAGEQAPDMLLVPSSPDDLPPVQAVAAVYTRRQPRGALLGLPHADDAAAIARAA